MKKLLYILPLIAMTFASCNNKEDLIFSESAAERLTNSRLEAGDKLVADGGLWAMEYFSNEEEPGYVMLFRFAKDGSVEVSANHKWIGGLFEQERSLWKVISDNGTVLSFNSFNTLFHIFSDPADITGSLAPTNPETGKDIDETGYGHGGDYEFMIMKNDDHNVMRMLGKKTGYNVYMYRLPSETNEKEYLENLDKKKEVFNTKFKTFILTDANGSEYEINNMASGIPEIYPRTLNDANGNFVMEGDKVSQTTSMNGIITYSGFRSARVFNAKNADESEWVVPELFWAEDGSLVNTELGYRLTAPSPVENFNVATFVWRVDPTSFTGKYAESYKKACDAVEAVLGTKLKLGNIDFTWSVDANGVMSHLMLTYLGAKKCQDFFKVAESKGTKLTPTWASCNSTAEKYDLQVPEYKAFKQMLLEAVNGSNNDPMTPSTIQFVMASDSQSSFKVNLQ